MTSQLLFPLLSGLKGIQLLLHSQGSMHAWLNIRIHAKQMLLLKYRQNWMKHELSW